MDEQIFLLVDAGNSAVKAQFWRYPGGVQRFFCEDRAPSLSGPIERIDNAELSVDRLVSAWRAHLQDNLNILDPKQSQIELAWVSVGPTRARDVIAQAYRILTDKDPAQPWTGRFRQMLPWRRQYFENAYHDPAQLGADRWVSGLGLAALGVMRPGEFHLVVSAGTATTFDLLHQRDDATCVFMGGWIIPGLHLMHQGLRQGTRQLDYGLSDAPGPDVGIPRDSQTAIEQGIALAQTALIDRISVSYALKRLWLHGGCAAQWARFYHGARQDHPGIALSQRQDLAFIGLLATAA